MVQRQIGCSITEAAALPSSTRKTFESELIVRGVSYEVISTAQYNGILGQIASQNVNMDIMKLEKPPKVAVYSPKSKQPWDDAVTLVLTNAEIPYHAGFDDEGHER